MSNIKRRIEAQQKNRGKVYANVRRDGVDRSWFFVVYDKNKKYKGLDGKLIFGAKNTRPYKSAPRTMMKPEEANRPCEFVMAHASHIQMWEKEK